MKIKIAQLLSITSISCNYKESSSRRSPLLTTVSRCMMASDSGVLLNRLIWRLWLWTRTHT